MAPQGRQRLQTWKEIGAYVQRDGRTVARWARAGLPVHHVPGLRSVFAYTDEIDAWLAREIVPAGVATPPRRHRRYLAGAATIAIVSILTVLAAPRVRTRPVELTAIEVRGHDLVGLSAAKNVAWLHTFERPIRIPEPRDDRIARPDLDGDGKADVIASILRMQAPPLHAGPQDEESLYAFTSGGTLLWSFELHDVLHFGGRPFEGPWYTSAIRSHRSEGRARVIWLAHHHTWWPSMAIVLDERGRRRSTFTHPGWLTNAAPLERDLVMVTGVNNALDADVVAILDERSWPGTPPPSGSPAFDCGNCPAGRPLLYFVLPRPELKAAANRGHVPAALDVFPTSIEVRTHESTDTETAAEIIYEFSREFRLRSVQASDSYWAWHRRLEATGAVRHTAERCPDRQGLTVRIWSRDRGWTDQHVGSM